MNNVKVNRSGLAHQKFMRGWQILVIIILLLATHEALYSQSNPGFFTAIAGSYKTQEEATKQASQLNAKGFKADVLHSDDYSNLNSGYWVVYSGVFPDKETAQKQVSNLLAAGHSAYLRFTGQRKATSPPNPDPTQKEVVSKSESQPQRQQQKAPVPPNSSKEAQAPKPSAMRGPSEAEKQFLKAAEEIERTYTGNPLSNNHDAYMMLNFTQIYGKKLACQDYQGNGSVLELLLIANGYYKSSVIWKEYLTNRSTGETQWQMNCGY